MNFFLIFCILKDECGDLPEWQERLDFFVVAVEKWKILWKYFFVQKKSKNHKNSWDGWNKIMQKMSPGGFLILLLLKQDETWASLIWKLTKTRVELKKAYLKEKNKWSLFFDRLCIGREIFYLL